MAESSDPEAENTERAIAALMKRLPARLDVHVDSPRWSFIKRSDDGRPSLISPLPCPFNYGHVPGTLAPDGDALDAILLGRRRATGVVKGLHVLGLVDFVDDGLVDTKIVVGAELEHLRREGLALTAFFLAYSRFKKISATLRGVALSSDRVVSGTSVRGVHQLTRIGERWVLSRWPGSRPSP